MTFKNTRCLHRNIWSAKHSPWYGELNWDVSNVLLQKRQPELLYPKISTSFNQEMAFVFRSQEESPYSSSIFRIVNYFSTCQKQSTGTGSSGQTSAICIVSIDRISLHAQKDQTFFPHSRKKAKLGHSDHKIEVSQVYLYALHFLGTRYRKGKV